MMWWINLAGLLLIFSIIWWFWWSKPKIWSATQPVPVEIMVEHGVYSPSRIQVSLGQPVVLHFMRKDPSPCAQKVVFEQLGLSVDLPLDQVTEVRVQPVQPGEYTFMCEMGMYRGSLVVQA